MLLLVSFYLVLHWKRDTHTVCAGSSWVASGWSMVTVTSHLQLLTCLCHQPAAWGSRAAATCTYPKAQNSSHLQNRASRGGYLVLASAELRPLAHCLGVELVLSQLCVAVLAAPLDLPCNICFCTCLSVPHLSNYTTSLLLPLCSFVLLTFNTVRKCCRAVAGCATCSVRCCRAFVHSCKMCSLFQSPCVCAQHR